MPLLAVLGNGRRAVLAAKRRKGFRRNGSCCHNPSRCRHNNPLAAMVAGGVAAGVAGAVANRLLRNPSAVLTGTAPDGTLYRVVRKSSTREWMVRAYVGGKIHEGKTYYTPWKDDAIGTFNFLMAQKASKNPLTAKEAARLLRESRLAARVSGMNKWDQTHRSFFGGKAVGIAHAVQAHGPKRAKRAAIRLRMKGRVAGFTRLNPGASYRGAKVREYRVPPGSESRIVRELHNRFVWAVPRDSAVLTIAPPSVMQQAMSAAFGGRKVSIRKRVTAFKNPGSEQPVIDVPFRTGRKYSVVQVARWVEANGTPAMKKRFHQAMEQYKRFHKGSLPKFITYSQYKMGSHPGISDVEFGVSEGHEWMAAYQVPKSSGKWADQASNGRYVHAHGDSEIDVDVKRPVNLSKLPVRFHTPDGKAVGVIPSKNVKIGEWYEG